jgi:sugar transferase (PEP-CTERM/EpsH1 system associated)
VRDLLLLTHRIPYPPDKGDKVRSYHLLKQLTRRFRVHLGTFVDTESDWQYVDDVRRMCGETCFVRLDPLQRRIASLQGLFRGEALTLSYYRHAKLSAWVNELRRSHAIRHVLAFSSAMGQYVVPDPETRSVADLVDVDSDKWRQYASTQPWPLSLLYRREAEQLLAYERRVARSFDATVFVNSREAELFARLAPESKRSIRFVNNGVDADYFSPLRQYADPYRQGAAAIAFTGAMDYWPNVDAAQWFAQHIFPALRRRFANCEFHVVGARPARQVRRLERLPGVTVTGTVPDIRPYLAHACLVVAPLRIARGTQNKILEGMAMARPVLASVQAAAGIDARSGEEIMVAGDADEFILQAIGVLEGQVAAGLGINARERVLRDYDWAANLAGIEALLDSEMQPASALATEAAPALASGREHSNRVESRAASPSSMDQQYET